MYKRVYERTHTHTHTDTHIYIYKERERKKVSVIEKKNEEITKESKNQLNTTENICVYECEYTLEYVHVYMRRHIQTYTHAQIHKYIKNSYLSIKIQKKHLHKPEDFTDNKIRWHIHWLKNWNSSKSKLSIKTIFCDNMPAGRPPLPQLSKPAHGHRSSSGFSHLRPGAFHIALQIH